MPAANSTTVSNQPSTLTKRGLATRKALLNSTLSMIAAKGYAATTVQVVLDDCGISRGSLLHLFKTRESLMVAAAEEALDRILHSIQSSLEKVSDPIEAMASYPDVLWRVQNQTPARAFAEIQLAARWDKALRKGLRRAVSAMNEQIEVGLRLFAEENDLKNIERLIPEINALISAMQNLAISKESVSNKQLVDDILDTLNGHYQRAFEQCLPDK